MARDYQKLVNGVSRSGARSTRMSSVVELLWEDLHAHGVSWVGFYLHEGRDELVLGPRRDKPACSPIGLHGVCGQSFREQRAVVVRDVLQLGANYVACDPRDRSEVVVPLFDGERVWGVLDADSFDIGAFDANDAYGLACVLYEAELTSLAPEALGVRIS